MSKILKIYLEKQKYTEMLIVLNLFKTLIL